MESPTTVAMEEEEDEENGGAVATSLNYSASPYPFPGGNLTRIKRHCFNGSSASTSSGNTSTRTLQDNLFANHIPEPKFHISPSYPACSFPDEIFKGVIDFIFPLMSHQHGHALFEMLVQFCAKDYRLKQIAGSAISEVLRQTTLNGFCLKSIGKLIKALGDSDFIEDVMKIFSSNFFRILISSTELHLILKSIDLLSPSKNELLYEAAVKNALDLAIHEKGCINWKNFISSSRGPGRGQLLQLITESSVFLSQDPFGNFVLQHVLDPPPSLQKFALS